MRNWVQRIHFIGIGGAGMRGIAEVLLNLGYHVSGSDIASSKATLRLSDLGARIFLGHEPANVRGADVVVISSAIPKDNPELTAAQQEGIPVIPRAEMLAELMRFKQGIAVAGTHGKTTTTSLVASILAEAGLDPTFVIGGLVHAFGTHAVLGEGDYLVAEADESDGSFLCLTPVMAVITNIDKDHLETYQNDFGLLQGAFLKFVNRLPFYGLAVLCLDDEAVRQLLPRIQKPILTYGTSADADLEARQITTEGLTTSFEVWRKLGGHKVKWLDVRLRLPGHHNVLNALAAIGIASRVGVCEEAILKALAFFGGIGRRFQYLGEARGAIFIDDYGHHPKEIRATLQAARAAWPQRKLRLIFQPHRYSRTKTLFDQFGEVLKEADEAWITEIYSAGEAPIEGVDGKTLAEQANARFAADFNAIPEQIIKDLDDNQVILTMGAGNIGKLAARWSDLLGDEWWPHA